MNQRPGRGYRRSDKGEEEQLCAGGLRVWPKDLLSQPTGDKARVPRPVVGSCYRPGFIVTK